MATRLSLEKREHFQRKKDEKMLKVAMHTGIASHPFFICLCEASSTLVDMKGEKEHAQTVDSNWVL